MYFPGLEGEEMGTCLCSSKPHCTLSSTDLNRTSGLRQDAAKTSINFDDQILTFKNECPSTFNRT